MFVIFLGLPGAGKGTQAARLASQTGLVHVTTGEIFRENIRNETDLGKKAKPFVESGRLVPDEITIGMLLDRISQPDCADGCLLDGFPRNTSQAAALDEALSAQGRAIDKVVYIKVDEEELVRRLAGRWSCPGCGAVYHETSEPPKEAGICDSCSSKLRQREDDRPEIVVTRLKVNMEQLQPMLDFYRAQNKVSEVDGARDAEVITDALKEIIAG
ncbi:MAG: adenylate kinase [Chloroflexi bacterium]|nr:adenylate kinase [Chloroflexota bacterium]